MKTKSFSYYGNHRIILFHINYDFLDYKTGSDFTKIFKFMNSKNRI